MLEAKSFESRKDALTVSRDLIKRGRYIMWVGLAGLSAVALVALLMPVVVSAATYAAVGFAAGMCLGIAVSGFQTLGDGTKIQSGLASMSEAKA